MNKKNALFSFVIILLFAFLAACGNDEGDTTDTEEATDTNDVEEVEDTEEVEENQVDADAETEVEDEAIAVDRGLMNVEITLPASFVGTEEDADLMISQAKEDGFTDIAKNDDGSLTYKMTRGKHNEMMEEIATEIDKSIEDIATDEELVSIEEVTANKDYSEFTVLADQVVYENSFDGFATMALGMSGLLYQIFDGVSPDDYEVIIHLEDTTTGEVFGTIEYPEVLEEMEEMEIEE